MPNDWNSNSLTLVVVVDHLEFNFFSVNFYFPSKGDFSLKEIFFAVKSQPFEVI